MIRSSRNVPFVNSIQTSSSHTVLLFIIMRVMEVGLLLQHTCTSVTPLFVVPHFVSPTRANENQKLETEASASARKHGLYGAGHELTVSILPVVKLRSTMQNR